jgi:hypothetical protein
MTERACRRGLRRTAHRASWGSRMGAQYLAGCTLRFRQSQVLCDLRRVCLPVVAWKHALNERKATPFGIF